MKIIYNLNSAKYSFFQNDKLEISKLNFLLTNSKGDFLNLGLNENFSKFLGYNYCDKDSLEMFKILDEISIKNYETYQVEYSGFKVSRKLKSTLIDSQDSTQIDFVEDSFLMGPSGGFVYEINNYDGNLQIDLDMKKQFDFDCWGRDYQVYVKNGIVFVEYTKKSEDSSFYKLYFGIKSTNFDYNLLKDWVEKSYSYSKSRNTQFKLYVYKLMSINILGSKKIYFGMGKSEKEVLSQINILENKDTDFEKLEKNIYNELVKEKSFEKPISENLNMAYKLSNNALYNFFNKDLNSKFSGGFFAGFPWFSKVWTRDDLVGLRGFINDGEYLIVKNRLNFYLENISNETGILKRIYEKDSLESCDSIFWFAKRLGDFIYKLEVENKFSKVFTRNEIEEIYQKWNFSFSKIIQEFWHKDFELLKVKDGDSWMDTIPAQMPMDIQVQFLEFVSLLSSLAIILQKKEESNRFLDFEAGLRENIRNKYFRKNNLYNEVNSNDLRSNMFLAYYFHPQLFHKNEWEIIFDNALINLKTTWGGISSLSKNDPRFKKNYTGEKNESYHNGDSWYWINNITAIVLNDINEIKYRKTIRDILVSSTNDILKMGTIGYGSEISSASKQKAEGCLAQLWSSSTYIEMIDSLFIRK